MNPFACAVDLRGGAIGLSALDPVLAGLTRTDDRPELVLDGCWGGVWVPSPLGRPAATRQQGVVAIGTARLSNRASLAGLPADRIAPLTDLDLVVAQYLRRGPAALAELVGDFAFVLWDPSQAVLLAARDGLGVKPLYYQQRGSTLLVASHLECLEQGGYDPGYLTRFMAGEPGPDDATVYANVKRLAPGTYLIAQGPKVSVETHWSPWSFPAGSAVGDAESAVAEFRALFEQAVRAQVDDGQETWALLSGGLDSSSVVGTVGRLARAGQARPLAGTVTVVDSLADGDETRYSNAVARRWSVANEQVRDFWAWQACDDATVALAEPRHFLPFYARDREIQQVVRRAGGRVVLSGYGSDQYLSGSFDYIADLVRTRQTRAAMAELVDLAVATRRSFWQLGLRHAIRPIAPPWLARRIEGPALRPAWVLGEPPPGVSPEEARRRIEAHGVFGSQVAAEVGWTDRLLDRGVFERGLEMRYPFLHRPLVEFVLRLPVGLRVRPGAKKWILRESLRDVLPRAVRTRPGKGGIDGRILWSLHHERRLLRRMILDSHLAELGLVDRKALAAEFDAAAAGQTANAVRLFFTLSLETWLGVRSGWWAANASRLQSGVPSSVSEQSTRKEQYHVEASVH